MRRSFGGGPGGTSGGGGGGSMLRTVHKAVRAGINGGGATHEPFSHATTTTTATNTTIKTCNNKSNNTSNNSISLTSSSTSSTNNSSPFYSHNNIPISAAPIWPLPMGSSSPPYSGGDDESEWEYIDGSEDERGRSCFDDFVFGTVPSRDEVQHAVFALQHVLEPTSLSSIKNKHASDSDSEGGDQFYGPTTFPAVGTDSDWIEPLVPLYNSEVLRPYGADRVYDAFHLLNTEPSVRRMVVSLSSDKAIWNAVLNNEAVQEFRESLNQGEADRNVSESPEDGSDDSAKDILSRVFANIKAKVMELVDKITKLINEVFQPSEKTADGDANPSEERLRASFLLSVVVLLIVVVTRANQA